MDKKHIIIISVYFPPIISVASNRIFAFAKYLDSSKYKISVITLLSSKSATKIEIPNVDIHYIQNKQWIKRATFAKKYPFLIHKFRAAWNIMLNKMGVNDSRSWEKQAFKTVEKCATNWINTVIISSYPTESPLAVASKIKQKHPELKWIADLRDGISNNSNYSSDYFKNNHCKIEQNVLSQSDAITSVSKPIIDYLSQKNTRKNRIIKEIRNGFDFESGNNGLFNAVFTISYVGTFYEKRNPNIFFKAIEIIIDQKLIPNFQINFVGVGGVLLVPSKLKKYISIIEKVPYSEAVELMRNSDALLLVLPVGENKGVFSGKIFDYLGVMRPIIPLIDPDDVAAELIRETGAGKVAAWDSVDQALESILWTYHLWEKKTLPNYNRDQIQSYHRKNQVMKLSQIIEDLWN
ncbi:MAG: hypothetical protein PHI36_04420 [Bacteroidales bacterium]|nr:hypothetical protein [Bacteroidales bacterium]MDD4575656.1 hypothetical protein [Bacteroidales bacterium]